MLESKTDYKSQANQLTKALLNEKSYYWRTMNGLWLVREKVSGMVTSDVSIDKAIKLTETEAKNADFDLSKLTFFEKKPGMK
ncbi:hypothetical protein GHU05_04895 [Fructobacillus tropaeoli]|uniref:hypothetical protein n=1 Tax=Fructobacillus tropaeoli TaxID=709323 RepID=UPI001455DE22|nr:hypothetical protein [Fructobacillus tropaeoli]NLS38265.1 hypothetical protein [Fructobacillus tropaeoli]